MIAFDFRLQASCDFLRLSDAGRSRLVPELTSAFHWHPFSVDESHWLRASGRM
jgi:hypothetical protein